MTMRGTKVFAVFVAVFLPLVMVGVVFVTPVAATTIRVPTDYPTIQQAVDAANPGDTILVEAGVYKERLFVNTSLTLVGNGSSTTVIDGEGVGTVVQINAPNCEIRGFTVKSGGGIEGSGIAIGRRAVNSTVRDCVIRNNLDYGITMFANESRIVGNTIMNSYVGIQIKEGSYNVIYENTIAKNPSGVWITSNSSLNNAFYCNNFIDNTHQVSSFAPTTEWDNGTKGNYWSDYTGLDDGSNSRTAGDGVGDTLLPYYTLPLGEDNYPLITPTRPFPVVVNDILFFVAVLSNSTVSSFYFSQPNEIGFNVNGPLDTTGFIEIYIPTALMNDTFSVRINGTIISHSVLPNSNSTYTGLYFTYNQAPQDVRIVPEFPAVAFLPIFVVATLIVTVSRNRKGSN